MEIELELFAYLTDYSPTGEKKVKLSIEDGATLEDLCRRLGMPPQLEKICFTNGNYQPMDKKLQDGDVVSFYPMLDGG
jgi:molybdopterin synthase sulfur carrier subunit